MGSSGSSQKKATKMIKEELGLGQRQVPVKTANKLSKSICKIIFTNNED